MLTFFPSLPSENVGEAVPDMTRENLEKFSFPKNTSGRSFQSKWLSEFEWLEYSKEEDAAYCLPCRKYGINANDIFTKVGYNNWQKALSSGKGFKQHENTQVHLTSVLSWKDHVKRIDKKIEISSLLNDTVLEKRQYYVKKIISTVFFLAQNELAFRGNWMDEENDESGTINIFFFCDKRF